MRKIALLATVTLISTLFFGEVPAYAADKVSVTKISTQINPATVTSPGSSATFTWSSLKVPAKTRYVVEVTGLDNLDFTRTFSTTALTLTVNSLGNFKKYYVQVYSKALGESSRSEKKFFETNNLAVGNLAATDVTYTSVTVTWDRISGASGYEVYVDDKIVSDSPVRRYKLTGLAPGTTRTVNVRPKGKDVKGVFTNNIKVVTLNTAPADFEAKTVGTTTAALNWTSVPGADNYTINKDGKLLATSKISSYTVVGLLPGSTSEFTVSAVFDLAKTLETAPLKVTTLMNTPGKPKVSIITAVGATIAWDIDSLATGFNINIYDAAGTTLVKNIKALAGVGSTVVTSLTYATNYNVRVNNMYGTATSKESELVPFATVRPIVTGVTTTAVTSTSVILNWTLVPGASSYEVYKDNILTSSGITSTTNGYTFTGLAPGQSYRLSVRAVLVDSVKGTTYTDITELVAVAPTDPLYRPNVFTAPVITVTGSAIPTVDTLLSASNGVWTATPAVTSYVYQWQRSSDGGNSWVNISGATLSTYRVTINDIGYVLRISVSATNSNGTGVGNSLQTIVIGSITNTQIPIIIGETVVGQVLSVTGASWYSGESYNLSYQWITSRTGTAAAGSVSTSATYVIDPAEVGFSIFVRVTASTPYGFVTVTTPSRGIVTINRNLALPEVSSSAADTPFSVGETLTATNGLWMFEGVGTTYSYQWQRTNDAAKKNWISVDGANTNTYVLAAGDDGYYFRVQVTAIRSTQGAAEVSVNTPIITP